MPLRLRRGTNADRTTITPVQGEPIYTTDTKQLYIGDGTTAGGVQVGGGGTLSVNTQDFTASGTWTKPANALWVEVTMCGAGTAGDAGTTGTAGEGGFAGRTACKTFLASDLASTVSVTCGVAQAFLVQATAASSSFGTHIYAAGGGYNSSNELDQLNNEVVGVGGVRVRAVFGSGAELGVGGYVGFPMGPGGGGAGGYTSTASTAGGKASSGQTASGLPASGGGGAGGASGTTGVAGTAGGYDTITGFGNGGGGGGEGTAGAGGAGGAAVRGGGGGGGGKGTTAGGAGGAGGAGFVRVRTLCFG